MLQKTTQGTTLQRLLLLLLLSDDDDDDGADNYDNAHAAAAAADDDDDDDDDGDDDANDDDDLDCVVGVDGDDDDDGDDNNNTVPISMECWNWWPLWLWVAVTLNSLRASDTYICVSQLITIVSDNGLSTDRRQAIIWNNDGILLFGPVGRNFNEILIEIYTFSFMKMRLKVSSAKCCLGLNVF